MQVMPELFFYTLHYLLFKATPEFYLSTVLDKYLSTQLQLSVYLIGKFVDGVIFGSSRVKYSDRDGHDFEYEGYWCHDEPDAVH